jgi:hypothetical protein
MARPGDIDDDIHSRVKAYAAINAIDVPEAYERIILNGTVEAGVGAIGDEEVGKLSEFADDKGISLLTAAELIFDAVLDEDGKAKQGTVIKNINIEKMDYD